MYSLNLNLKSGVKFKINQDEVLAQNFPQEIQEKLQKESFCISGKRYAIAYVDEQTFNKNSSIELSLSEALV